MQVSEAVEQYRYALFEHSEATQVWYLSRLQTFVAWCVSERLQLEDIKTPVLRRYMHHLSTTISTTTGNLLSSSTIHGHARTIRTFLNWCAREEDLGITLKAPKMAMPKMDDKIIETFSHEQIKALQSACDKEYADHLIVRDKAIIALLLDTGIRAQELVTLTIEDVRISPEDSYIRVTGKGRKQREIGLGHDARVLLAKYVNRYRNATHTVPDSEKHVFLSRFSKPLTVNGLDQLFSRLGDWAHVEGVRCSPHTVRHTFAVEYLKNGGDVFKLSRLMGHTSVQTTMVYLKCFQAKDARADGISVMDAINGKHNLKRKP